MVQSVVGSVTIGAIVVISIICAVYLLILKKSGWLGGNAQFFRCPNQDCKRIFQKPIRLNDLSETPARVYDACPECGVDLEPFLASFGKEKLKMSAKSSFDQPKPKMKSKVSSTSTKFLKRKFVEGLECKAPLGPPQDAKPQVVDVERERILDDAEASGVSFEVIEKPKILAQVPQISVSISKERTVETSNSEVEVSEDESTGCSHFFGYLHSLPEDTSAPSSCFFCLRMADCYMDKK